MSAPARFFAATHRNPTFARLWFVGDSWFRYPPRFQAIAPTLERRYRRHAVVLNEAIPGADTESLMANIRPRIRERLAAWEFDLLLVSIGGNDIVGPELAHLIKRRSDPQPEVPGVAAPTQPIPEVVNAFLMVKPFMRALRGLEDFYRDIFDARDATAAAVPVVMHCYAKLHVTGLGFKLGPIRSGPWIRPALDGAGVPAGERNPLIDWMLTEYRAMLRRLAREAPTTRLLVDTLDALPDIASWDNEIHPTGPGFRHLVDHFWAPVVDPLVGFPR